MDAFDLEMQTAKGVAPKLGHSQGDLRSYTEVEMLFHGITRKSDRQRIILNPVYEYSKYSHVVYTHINI